MIMDVAEGQYLLVLESVSPVQEKQLLALMTVNHVEWTGYPAAGGSSGLVPQR